MTQSPLDPEIELSEQLVKFDEALAAGIAPTLPPLNDPKLQSRFEQAQACLQFLDRDRRQQRLAITSRQDTAPPHNWPSTTTESESPDVNSRQTETVIQFELLSTSDRSSASAASGIPTRHVTAETIAEGDDISTLGSGHRIGRFQLIRRLGSGGFGVVYLANDPVLHRLVALKIPRPETLATPDLQRRFVRESQLAAKLTHPHLVPVYEAGQAGPISYQVTAYCAGGALSSWLRNDHTSNQDTAPDERLMHNSESPSPPINSPQQHKLPIHVAVELMIGLAEGVHHAHQHGILHRDIKPTNILLHPKGDPSGKRDSVLPGSVPLADLCNAFEPMVSDFGLARLLDDFEETSPPQIGDSRTPSATLMAGTPQYMAPEQLEGRGAKIGPETDIYSLGAVLFEILTGRLAFSFQPPQSKSGHAVIQQKIPNLPKDLAAICLKCLSPQPASRYATASALAHDLRAFTRGEAVIARPWSMHERFAKWSRRRPAVASLVVLVSCLLVALFAVGGWHLNQLRKLNNQLVATIEEREIQTQHAIKQSDRANEQAKIAMEKTELAMLHGLRSEKLACFANQREYAATMLRADDFWQKQQIRPMAALLQQYLPRPDRDADDPRGFEWRYLFAKGQSLRDLAGHMEQVLATAVTPEGDLCYSISEEGTIRRWDAHCGALLAVWPIPELMNEHVAHINSQATRAIFRHFSSGQQELILWDLQAGKELFRKPLGEFEVRRVVIAPDGSWAAVGVSGKDIPPTILTLDLNSQVLTTNVLTPAAPNTQYSVDAVAISPNGKQLWASLQSSLPSLPIHGIVIKCALKVQTVSAGEFPKPPEIGEWSTIKSKIKGINEALTFSPDGEFIAIGMQFPSSFEIRNTMDGALIQATPDLKGPAGACAFDASGENLIIGSLTPTYSQDHEAWSELMQGNETLLPELKFWKFQDGLRATTELQLPQAMSCISRHEPTGTWAIGDDGGRLILWRPGPVKPYRELKGHQPSEAWGLAFAPDGKTLYSVGDDAFLRGWDVRTGEELQASMKHTSLVSCIAVSPDGRWVATGSYSDDVVIWRADTLQVQMRLNGHTDDVRTLAFSPDSKVIASAGRDCTIRRWNVPEGTFITHAEMEGGTVRSIAFQTNDQLLAVHSFGRIQSWASSGLCKLIRNEKSETQCLALSPVGIKWLRDIHSTETLADSMITTGPNELLLYGKKNGMVKLLHLPTGKILMEHNYATIGIRSVAFSPDGRNFAVASNDCAIHIWNVPAGQEVLTIPNLPAPANQIAFSPSGDSLAAALHDGTIRIWDAPFIERSKQSHLQSSRKHHTNRSDD
ncbi:WD40 repeat domain-containing serine/threonine protein kinase [Schlesneria paludicola]|uniref:WD40 repeat domain-containing serine/threonine protein kinase n=1 Tax=Schlesneria paludicola TaxID=360056 RepID=UPI00029A3CA3|nr:protein kinase [Schlesneria paludicola]